MTQQNFDPSNLTLRGIVSSDHKQIQQFRCGNGSMDNFLVTEAYIAHIMREASTTVVLYEEKIVAYFTLCHSIIKFYLEVDIPKKSGGTRKLACPSKKVKVVQAWILRNILEKVEANIASTAFKKGSTVIQNVKPHVDNRYLLCMDIKDFFDNITFYDVFHIFRSLGYDATVSALLSNICYRQWPFTARWSNITYSF
ncbi:MAG: hypothetical protein H6Q71_1160 [Firmicutes bacterium]|nr:hypothetical protein [Bacillota bacterium]